MQAGEELGTSEKERRSLGALRSPVLRETPPAGENGVSGTIAPTAKAGMGGDMVDAVVLWTSVCLRQCCWIEVIFGDELLVL